MTPIKIIMFSLWLIAFSGGLSLGAILSAREVKEKCPWIWKLILVLSIVFLILMLC